MLFVGNGLTQRLDREPGVLERVRVRLEGMVHLMERHRQPVPLDRHDKRAVLQVRIADHERLVIGLEPPG